MGGRAGAAIVWAMLAVSPALAWRVDLRGGRLHSQDAARAAAALPGGDTVLVADLDCDATVLRIDRTGAVVWRTEVLTSPYTCLASPPGLDSSPPPIAVDGDDAIVLALGGLVVKLDAATGAERWRRQIDAGPFETFLDALVVDPGGGVAVAGVILPEPGEPEHDFLVASLDGVTGAERWRLVRNGTPGPPDPDDADWDDTSDEATALALDGAGNLIVTGVVERHGHPRWYVFQLAADTGAVRWQQRIRRQEARLLAVDVVSDEIVVAGVREGGGVAVQAFRAASGTRRWRHVLFPRTGGLPRSLLAAPDWDLAVVKLAGDTGPERWRVLVTGTADGSRDVASALTTDSAGDVVVAGTLEDAYGPVRGTDFFVAKLAADTGAERWRRIVTFPYGQPFAIAVDAQGDVVAAGVASAFATSSDFVVLKLAGDTGADRWRTNLNGTDGAFESARALALAPDGDVVACGYLQNVATGADWTVVRLAGDSGVERWRHVVDGVAHGSDVAAAVALDASGDLLVAGTLQAGPESWEVLVARLDGATGAERWRRIAGTADPPVPPAVALASARNGDALLTSAQTSGVQEQDFLVVRMVGSDGSEAWRRVLSGSTPGVGWGAAIAERADGAVVVAGRTVNAGSGPDFTLATLASADGSDVPAVP
jgi:hypothetical protein